MPHPALRMPAAPATFVKTPAPVFRYRPCAGGDVLPAALSKLPPFTSNTSVQLSPSKSAAQTPPLITSGIYRLSGVDPPTCRNVPSPDFSATSANDNGFGAA